MLFRPGLPQRLDQYAGAVKKPDFGGFMQ